MTVFLTSYSLPFIPSSKKELAKKRWNDLAKKIKELLQGMKEIKEAQYKGLILNELYWSEKFIPSHPSVAEYISFLQEWKKMDFADDPISFNDWVFLENDHYWETSVSYLKTQEERQSYLISFRDGKLYDNHGMLINQKYMSLTGTEFFVIGPDQNFYLFKKDRKSTKRQYQHSTLFSGGAVIGAGMISVNDQGKITEIANASGHYCPNTDNMLDALKVLQQKGVQLKGILVEMYDLEKKRSNFYPCAETYLSTSGTCPPSLS